MDALSATLWPPLCFPPNSRRLPEGLCQMDDAVSRSCVCCIVYVSKGSPFGLPHKASRNSQQWQQKQADLSFPLQRGARESWRSFVQFIRLPRLLLWASLCRMATHACRTKSFPPHAPSSRASEKRTIVFFQGRSLLCSLGTFSPNSHAIMSSSFSTHSLWGSSP